ncbi:MAG: orotidine 5'-phosphate decarboxylase [Candidatus Odinarchaeia archaeon]
MVKSFSKKLKESSLKNNSKLILALDLTSEFKLTERKSWNIKKKLLLKKATSMINTIGDKIAGVKINRQLILTLGLYDLLPELLEVIKDFKLPVIADCKINDVGHTNEWITKHYLNAGFNAVIANPFIGWDMGVDKVFNVAEKYSAGVILLVYMSHPGAAEGYGQYVVDNLSKEVKPQYLIFAEKAKQWEADGVIVGATAPEKIADVAKIVNDIPIISPGVGIQGGSIEKALAAGSNYLIVGRNIIESEYPNKVVDEFNKKINNILRGS